MTKEELLEAKIIEFFLSSEGAGSKMELDSYDQLWDYDSNWFFSPYKLAEVLLEVLK